MVTSPIRGSFSPRTNVAARCCWMSCATRSERMGVLMGPPASFEVLLAQILLRVALVVALAPAGARCAAAGPVEVIEQRLVAEVAVHLRVGLDLHLPVPHLRHAPRPALA